MKCKKVCASVLSLLCLGLIISVAATPAMASVYYADFSSISGLARNGSAIQSGSVLRLVNTTVDRGSFWYTGQQFVADGFETTFTFPHTSANAGGFAFVIQNESTSALGGWSGCNGYGDFTFYDPSYPPGITHSLAIEFDNEYNYEWSDPQYYSHISVHGYYDGANDARHLSYVTHGTAQAPTYGDGTHTAKITYDGQKTLKIYVDNMSTPVLTITNDELWMIGLNDGKAWVGFTAGTSGTAANVDISSWSFLPVQHPAVVYYMNFNHGTVNPSPATYVPGNGEILPSGITYGVGNGDLSSVTGVMGDPGVMGPDGGQVMKWLLPSKWPNNGEGYKFGSPGSPGPVISDAYTIEAFITPHYDESMFGLTFGITDQSHLIDSTVDSTGFRLMLDQLAQRMVFEPATGSSTGRVVSTTTMVEGQWYHVAAVVRSGAVARTELWINGVLEGTGTYSDTFEIPGYFKIGSPYDSNVQAKNFQGEVDALAISDTALSPNDFVLDRFVSDAVAYMLNFDHGVTIPGPSPYVQSAGEILQGITGYRYLDDQAAGVIDDPSLPSPDGGQVMEFHRGSTWPHHEGYRFGNDGTLFGGPIGPILQNEWTIEAYINPDYTNTGFGLTANSTLFDSRVSTTGVRIRLDQNTHKLLFEPYNSDTAYGAITSTTTLDTGKWYHIAAVVRPSGGYFPQRTELWINGALEGTGGYPTGWETQGVFNIPGYFNLGAPYVSTVNSQNFQGEIDGLAISGYALDYTNFVLPLPIPYEPRAVDFGKQWIRQHPFVLQAWSCRYADYLLNTGTLNTFVDSNMNTAWIPLSTNDPVNRTTTQDLNLINPAKNAGLAWQGFIGNSDLSVVSTRVNAISSPDEDNAWYIVDEPGQSTLPAIGEIADWLKAMRPKALSYVSIHPYDVNDTFVASLMQNVDPDILMTGSYPYTNSGFPLWDMFFGAVTDIRYYSSLYGKPFWMWQQCYTEPPGQTYMPSESQMRMTSFANLTAGCKGIAHFLYDSLADGSMGGMVTAAGGTTSQYTYAQSMNPEISNLGKSLRYLESTGLFFVPGPARGGVLTDCESAWTSQQGTNVTCTADGTDKKVGSYSAKNAVASGATTGLLATKAITSTNMSAHVEVYLWIKSSVAVSAGQLQLLLDNTANCASPTETLNVPALSANTWTRLSRPLAAPGADTAIISVGIKQTVDIGAFNLWLDDVSTIPMGLTKWSSTADPDVHITNITINSAQAIYRDGLIGFFTDDSGQKYFMLTNLFQWPGYTKEDAATSFTITFDSGVNTIYRLRRSDGVAEAVSLTNNQLMLSLPGGTGDLFKYDNGTFAGL